MDWIKISDAKPPYCESVLIWNPNMAVTTAYLRENDLWVINECDEYEIHYKLDEITHWMSLPSPPKDE